MKTFLNLMSASLLLTSPALVGQAAERHAMKTIHLAIDAVDADLCLVLLACNNDAIRLGDGWLLVDAVLHPVARRGNSFVADLWLPAALAADVWWQAATIDLTKGFELSAISKLPVDLAATPIDADAAAGTGSKEPADLVDADGDGIADGDATKKQDGGPADGDVDDGDVDDADKKEPADKVLPLPLQLALEGGAAGDVGMLRASFTAPTDDYGLAVVDVVMSEDAGSADVYLYRKVPGPGEGLRDIVEEHSVTAHIGTSRTVRVFLAEGTSSRPGKASAFTLVAVLQQ